MKGVNPCPYCGGEVEVVKMVKREKEKKQPYRVECRQCRALVARGIGFPIESAAKAKERIRQYEELIARKPITHTERIFQTDAAKMRDKIRAKGLSGE